MELYTQYAPVSIQYSIFIKINKIITLGVDKYITPMVY